MARARIAASTDSAASQRRAAEGLRRLDRPQPRAVERGDDRAGVVGLLDRVRHPRGGDRAVRVLQRRDARAANSDGATSGRAASWTTTGPDPGAAASAARTDSLRVAPPRTPTHARGRVDARRAARRRSPRSPPRAARPATTRASAGRRPRRRPSGRPSASRCRGYERAWAPTRHQVSASGPDAPRTARRDDRGRAAGLLAVRWRLRPRAAQRCAGGSRRGRPRPRPRSSRGRTSSPRPGSSWRACTSASRRSRGPCPARARRDYGRPRRVRRCRRS